VFELIDIFQMKRVEQKQKIKEWYPSSDTLRNFKAKANKKKASDLVSSAKKESIPK